MGFKNPKILNFSPNMDFYGYKIFYLLSVVLGNGATHSDAYNCDGGGGRIYQAWFLNFVLVFNFDTSYI